VAANAPASVENTSEGKADLSSLTSMLKARWKGDTKAAVSKSEPLQVGQIRSFRIVKLDREAEKIEVELT
jgi:small subunit ribosomal protein S1